MLAKITTRTVDAVKPAGRDVFTWHTRLTGLGVKVTPRNRKVYMSDSRLARMAHHGPRTPPRR